MTKQNTITINGKSIPEIVKVQTIGENYHQVLLKRDTPNPNYTGSQVAYTETANVKFGRLDAWTKSFPEKASRIIKVFTFVTL